MSIYMFYTFFSLSIKRLWFKNCGGIIPRPETPNILFRKSCVIKEWLLISKPKKCIQLSVMDPVSSPRLWVLFFLSVPLHLVYCLFLSVNCPVCINCSCPVHCILYIVITLSTREESIVRTYVLVTVRSLQYSTRICTHTLSTAPCL